MHHTDLPQGWGAHHNGDYSGDITLLGPLGEAHRFDVPFEVIEELVAERVRSEKIGHVEEMNSHELLGVPWLA